MPYRGLTQGLNTLNGGPQNGLKEGLLNGLQNGLDASAKHFLPETRRYLNAILPYCSLSKLQQRAIDRYIRDLFGFANSAYATYNVWSKLTLLYPFPAGIYSADRVNLRTPGKYNFTDTLTPTYSQTTRSVAYNGTNNYSNTNFTPNTSSTFAGSNFTSWGFHRVDINSDTNATIGEVGGGNSFAQISTTGKTIVSGAKTVFSAANSNAINSCWGIGWPSSGTVKSYFNGTVFSTVSVAYDNTPSRSLLMGAFNNASPGFGGACTFDFHWEGYGAWSDEEQKMMYNATKALKKSFGINWT